MKSLKFLMELSRAKFTNSACASSEARDRTLPRIRQADRDNRRSFICWALFGAPSGTGAEATRTCVMTNKTTGLKLGMNSDYTVFDQLILDPTLTATVPSDQYFFSGMDAWILCVESLAGGYRNPIGDAFSTQAIDLCREVFGSGEMMSDDLYVQITKRYPGRTIEIDVSEDGENGSHAVYDKPAPVSGI